MTTLLLKLVLTPVLIAAASLAGRRWGPGVGGWLVGLPFTSGPVALFLALDHGTGFAARAALGITAGTVSQAAFCLAYGWLALHGGWLRSLLAASLAFALATAALLPLSLPVAAVALLVALLLGATLALMPRRSLIPTLHEVRLPAWDLPARMVVATIFVLLLTGTATTLGPRLAGLLAPFPVYAAVLTVFAHRFQSPAAALGVLHGLLFGLFGFAAFFVTLAVLLERTGIGIAFAAAIAVTLALQAASLILVRAGDEPRSDRQVQP